MVDLIKLLPSFSFVFLVWNKGRNNQYNIKYLARFKIWEERENNKRLDSTLRREKTNKNIRLLFIIRKERKHLEKQRNKKNCINGVVLPRLENKETCIVFLPHPHLQPHLWPPSPTPSPTTPSCPLHQDTIGNRQNRLQRSRLFCCFHRLTKLTWLNPLHPSSHFSSPLSPTLFPLTFLSPTITSFPASPSLKILTAFLRATFLWCFVKIMWHKEEIPRKYLSLTDWENIKIIRQCLRKRIWFNWRNVFELYLSHDMKIESMLISKVNTVSFIKRFAIKDYS